MTESSSGPANDADAQRETTPHRDFDKVDSNRHGYLTSDDVKSDDYVSRNFAKRNVKQSASLQNPRMTIEVSKDE